MTGSEKLRYFCITFSQVNVLLVIFFLYRIFLELVTYTHSGPSENARWLVPTTLVFPLAIIVLSIFNLFKKNYFKSIIMIFMLLYFLSIPIVMYLFGKGEIIENYLQFFIYIK